MSKVAIALQLMDLGVPKEKIPLSLELIDLGVPKEKIPLLINAGVPQEKVASVASYNGMETLFKLLNLGVQDHQIDYTRFEKIVKLGLNNQ